MKKILMLMVMISFVAGGFFSSADALPLADLSGGLYVYGVDVPMADIEGLLQVEAAGILEAKVEGGSDPAGEGIGTVSPPDSDFSLTVAGTSFDDEGDAVSGTWTANAAISAYVLKAGNYSLLTIIEPALSGTWSLDPLYNWLAADITTLKKNNDWTPALSHFDAFSTSAPVPEPATMLLLGTGLLGLAGVSRKKLSKTK